MAANINGTNIPNSMASPGRGRYLYAPPEQLARNGQGAVVTGDYASITWTFPSLIASDFDWWQTTLLAGAASLLITSASLWNHTRALVSFTQGVVLRPTYDYISNGYYYNVVIKIEDLL